MAKPYVKDLLASSEVVLIETRQHWMAAIRFALRPIVIALIGVGLLVLNNIFQLDGAFGFINDLITWAIVVLFLVSIVWIPIDLIRWDSRRYVLTNRRAMRVDGVLQKNSIDSSLEQITDIGMRETTFGRFLGYADLTLYTASDSANEQYEQLLDGKRFKIAVLEAKEAIRQGGSMDALPEDFVVKGGTNEASMRADGKLAEEEDAADAVAEAQGEADDAEPSVAPEPAPAVVAEPEPEPAASERQPEPVAEPEPVPAAVTEPEPVAEPADVAESEPVAEPEPEQPAAAAEPEPVVAEPEPAPAVVAEPEPVAKPEPEAEPVPEPEAEPVPEPEEEPVPEPEEEPETASAAEPVAEPALVVESEPERESEAGPATTAADDEPSQGQEETTRKDEGSAS